jgi:DNA-binding response OmpR family regulator
MRYTPTEELYLKALEAAPDGVSTSALESTRSPDPARKSNLVAKNIANLRKKLPPGVHIVALRAYGYKLIKQ